MSLSDDKRGVVNSIGAYNSMLQDPEPPDRTDSLSSMNNDDDSVPFLVDVIKVIAGSGTLVRLTGELLSNFLTESEPVLKESIKNQSIQENADDELPDYFKPSGDGINVPVENVDMYGKLKTDPNSDVGVLLFGNEPNTFDKTLYDSIATGNQTTYGNLNVQYNDDDTFTLKSTSADGSIGDWFNDFVDNTSLINEDEFIVDVMDGIFGSVTTNQDKTEEEIFNQLKIDKLLENGVEGNGFELSDEEIELLLRRANELKNGLYNIDLGCGVFAGELTLNGLSDFMNNISGSTDPNLIGEELDDVLEDVIDEDVLNENKDTIKDGFFTTLIRRIRLALTKAIIATPFGRIFQALVSAFKNGGFPEISANFQDDIDNFKVLIECVIKEIIKNLNKFIYVLAIGLLIVLLKPVIKKITKERITNYVRVIKSLLS